MRKFSLLGIAILATSAFFYTTIKAQKMDQTIYNFNVEDIDGKQVSLADYRGKVVLIVNVASECGYTPEYEHLQNLYASHKDQGLVVLGFPANDFGAQEPGSNAEIKDFCTARFGVNFPMFSKITVKGEGQHPLYQFLTTASMNGLNDDQVKWNFQKFLISKEGKLISVIPYNASVQGGETLQLIEAALK